MQQRRAARFGLTFLLVAAASAVQATPGQAEDPDDPAAITQRWFERNDLDKDGYLTAAEIGSGRDKQLRRIDIDGDGSLSLDEYRYGLPDDRPNQATWLEAQFAQMDMDGDGSVGEDEYLAYGDRLVAGADADQDTMVSLEEYFAVMLQ